MAVWVTEVGDGVIAIDSARVSIHCVGRVTSPGSRGLARVFTQRDIFPLVVVTEVFSHNMHVIQVGTTFAGGSFDSNGVGALVQIQCDARGTPILPAARYRFWSKYRSREYLDRHLMNPEDLRNIHSLLAASSLCSEPRSH